MLVTKRKERVSEAYPKHSQTSRMELLTISAKNSIINVWLSSEYASELSCKRSLEWQGINIPITHEKPTNDQSVTEWYGCCKCEAIDKYVECLYFHEVEAVEYFELLGMRYGDINAVTQRV